MKSYYLEPTINNQQSYYNKALVIEKQDGTKLLKSYNTDVCKITKNGIVKKLWNDYSKTTMNHINSFLCLFDKKTLNKKEWLALKK